MGTEELEIVNIIQIIVKYNKYLFLKYHHPLRAWYFVSIFPYLDMVPTFLKKQLWNNISVLGKNH